MTLRDKISILYTGPRTFAEEKARNDDWQKVHGNPGKVCANNGLTDNKDGKNYPAKVEGPSEIEAGKGATYTVTEFKENDKTKLPIDKKLIKWAFYIDGVEIQDKLINYVRVLCNTDENQESDTDYLDNAYIKSRTNDIKSNAILYAYIESNEPDENKDYRTKLTVKFSKWLDGHDVVIEAFRNKPDTDKNKEYAVVTKVSAPPEVVSMQWVDKDEKYLKYTDYTQEKYLKIKTLGLKDKEIFVTIKDATAMETRVVSFFEANDKEAITITDRNTLQQVHIYPRSDDQEDPPSQKDLMVYEIYNLKNNANQWQLPNLKLQVVLNNLEELTNTHDNNTFAKHLNIYPKEKIIETYFAKKLKIKIIGADGKEQEQEVYQPVNTLSIGQKTYLVAHCINLDEKTIKLKIHEKGKEGYEDKLNYQIQTSEEDYFEVCKPKKNGDISYKTLTNAEGWIEATVDKDSKQAVAELIMRPVPDKMASEKEDAAKSLEGWKEALYRREDEEPNYVAPSNNRPMLHTPLTYDANAQRKSYPEKVTLTENKATIGKDLHFECTFTSAADAGDKDNVRWCMYINDIHSNFPKVKKIKKDADNKDTSSTTEQNAYTLIADRGEIIEGDKDFLPNVTKTDFDSKAYLYARIEVADGKSKLAIQFSKHLVGKTIYIEAFRGNPDLDNKHDYVKTITLEEKEKTKIVEKLTTDLFVSANCLVEDEESNTSFEVKYEDKEVTTKLNAICFCDRDLKVREVKDLIIKLRQSESKVYKGVNKENLFFKTNCELTEKDKTFERFTSELNSTFAKYDINTCIRKIHFLAQAYHETDRFRTTKEYASTGSYAPYVGRGLMQLTWESNYIKYKSYSGVDCVKSYEKVAKDLFHAFNSAGWFWKKGKTLSVGDNWTPPSSAPSYVRKYNAGIYPKNTITYKDNNISKTYGTIDLNLIADDDYVDIISWLVNGGRNGLQERRDYVKKLKQLFNYETICHHFH